MKILNKIIIKTRLSHFALTFITLLLAMTTFNIRAANDELGVNIIVKPNQCIALYQGQQCYVDIDLTWSAEQAGDYCLYSSQQVKALQCWNENSNGSYKKEVVSSEDITFTIRLKGLDNILSSEVLKMAWVYRKDSQAKSAWRLF
jgi:hypothetical protein